MDDTRAIRSAAIGGVGLISGLEPILAPYRDTGELRLVLERWSTMGPGFHIHYSSRRQTPTGLRLVIDLVCELRPLGLRRAMLPDAF